MSSAAYGAAFFLIGHDAHLEPGASVRVMAATRACRTPALGGRVEQSASDCGHWSAARTTRAVIVTVPNCQGFGARRIPV